MPSATQESAVGDGRSELTALVSNCGLYRPDCVLFSITGPDRARWLNGMVTNNIRDLATERGVYAFVLNPQGHILGDLYVFNLGDHLIAQVGRNQSEVLLQVLRRYIIMDKVEIKDLTGQLAVIGLAGPGSAAILQSSNIETALEPLQIQKLEWNGPSIILLRGDNPSFTNYGILLPVEQAEALWNQLVSAGSVPVSDNALETFRILCGIPKFGQDIRDRILPQETGQDRALNFTKGCYIGQEIVERIRARGNVHRSFVGFEIEGSPPAPGTKIQSGGKDVGEITSVAAAPLKQKRLALGYLRKEALSEQALTAAGATVRSRPLPFTDIFD